MTTLISFLELDSREDSIDLNWMLTLRFFLLPSILPLPHSSVLPRISLISPNSPILSQLTQSYPLNIPCLRLGVGIRRLMACSWNLRVPASAFLSTLFLQVVSSSFWVWFAKWILSLEITIEWIMTTHLYPFWIDVLGWWWDSKSFGWLDISAKIKAIRPPPPTLPPAHELALLQFYISEFETAKQGGKLGIFWALFSHPLSAAAAVSIVEKKKLLKCQNPFFSSILSPQWS